MWALKWIDKEIEENERHAHQKQVLKQTRIIGRGILLAVRIYDISLKS